MANLTENSPTMIPGANIYKPHVESDIAALTIAEEAIQANREAEKQSSPPRKATL